MLRDRFTEKKLHKMSMEPLHGHTVIELKNVRTGKRERIEHDNTFTKGIEDYLVSGGYFNNSPWANAAWAGRPLYQNLLGGILLFDKEILPNGNGEYPITMPAGTKMVANGSYGVANNSAVTEMGTFNSQESSFTVDALTFVYDWSTSQANSSDGIACVCLTSDIGGYIGYGNSVSDKAHATTWDLFSNQTNVNEYKMTITRLFGTVVFMDDRILTTTKNIGDASDFSYSERIFPFKSTSLFNDLIVKNVTVDIPGAIQGTRKVFSAGIGKFAVMPDTITVNQAYTFGIYDVSGEKWTIHTLVPDVNISMTSDAAQYIPKFFDEGVYWMQSNKMFVFGEREFRTIDLSNIIVPVSNGIVLGNNGRIYDTVNKTNYATNMATMANPYRFNMWRNTDNQIIVESYLNNIDSLECYRNPLYLATVNNLEETVTKTSEQTMKVTYTVTKEEE